MVTLIKNVDYYLHENYNLPRRILGTVSIGSDGAYNIVINGNLYPEEKKHAFYHEMAHILLGHVDDPSIDIHDPAIEAEADAYIPQVIELLARWECASA